MNLNHESFRQFWNDADVVSHIVQQRIDGLGSTMLDLTKAVRSERQDIPGHTLEFAHVLLENLVDMSVNTDYSAPPKWFDAYLDTGLQTQNREEALTRFDEFLMEQLTAVWLVLYFLSTPMGHPWERAQRIAEEQGGYPAGACMTKMIGDVYRRLRQERPYSSAEKAQQTAPPEHDLIVLSNFPSLLIKDLIMRDEEQKTTPPAVHVLGRCYALFQLRLYLDQGGTMLYIVKLSALHDALKKCAGMSELSPMKISRRIYKWLQTLLPQPQAKQDIILYHGDDDLRLLPCALGLKSGVCSLESGTHGTRFVGNKVNKKLLTSLRDRLVSDVLDDPNPLRISYLLGKTAEELHTLFQFKAGGVDNLAVAGRKFNGLNNGRAAYNPAKTHPDNGTGQAGARN